MKILFFALFLLAAALLFRVLTGVFRKMAYPIEQRYLHCRMVPALLLAFLAAANVFTLSFPLELLDSIINSYALSPFFSAVLPNRAYELEYMMLVQLGLNLMAMVLAILVVFLVKLIFRNRTGFHDIGDDYGAARLLHLPWLFVRHYYTERDGSACLNGKGFTAGIWMRGLKSSFAILWALELFVVAVSILWGGDTWNEWLLTVTKNWYLLPMAAFLLLQQIQFFLEGTTEDEAGTFGSMEIQETQNGSISTLLDASRLTFQRSDALLYSDISADSVPPMDGLGSNDLGNQQLEDCSQPDVLHVITNQLQQCGVRQCEQYQNALSELLNGRSINVCDQCEGEFLVYLCAYLNYHMAQGRTALVLCRDRKQADQLCKAMNREMQRLNSLYSIWSIRTLEGAEVNSRMSILVCSVDDFLNHHIFEKRQDFVSDLFCTVFSDGIHLFSSDRLRVEQLFGILRSIDGIRQYVAFSEANNDAMRTAMEQAVKQEVLPFSNNTAHRPSFGVMIWRGESSCRLQHQLGLGSTMNAYMGAALPLALVAIKYDFPRVYVIGDSVPGFWSFNDVLNSNLKEVFGYLARNANLRSQIRYQPDEALKQQELSVTVVHDTEYNFLNVLSLWYKYCGTKGSLLHIVTPPYALREYFVANFRNKKFSRESSIFDALISSHLGTRISHMMVLLVAMGDKGMTEKELMDKVAEYGWEYDNVDQLLRDCLKVVLTRQEIHSVYECFHFEEEKIFREDQGDFEVQTRITLIDSTIRSRLHNLAGCATLVSKNDQHQALPILCGNITNYCLRHQIISADGYLYQVHSIAGSNIHAEQVLPQDLPEYFQVSDFTFDNYRLSDHCVDTGLLDLNLCTADVTRTIYGYLSCDRGNAFANSTVMVSNIGQPLEVRMDCVNILQLRVRRSEFGDKAAQTMRLFAYLIKDFAKTLFPVTHQNLYAVLSDGADPEQISRVLASGSDASLEDMVCCLIPRLRNTPADDPEHISLYIVEYSCVEFGMVQMLFSRYQNLLLMMREYLSWYLTPESSAEYAEVQGRYLHFGSGSVPEVLAPEILLDFLRKLAPEVPKAADPVQVDIDMDVPPCSFCERPSIFPVVFSDGRRMCAHCKDHQLTQKAEIKSLFAETVRYMTEGYSISLPRNLHVRFQSADAIRKATGETSGGRVLGFYNTRTRQLWLEARGPKIAIQSTLIHELTHAWQFHDPTFRSNLQKVLRKYPKDRQEQIRLRLLEGHAAFMEVHTMRKINEEAYSERLHASYMRRSDVYGIGYRMLHSYILEQGELGSHMTPYKAMQALLQDILNGDVEIT